MVLAFEFFLLFVGLIALWKIGELAVRNAIGFSLIYKIETFTVGFFIFAISTGLPEISSAVVSSIQQVPELSAGDLMGSTFVNVSLVLGVSVILAKTIEIDHSLRKKLFRTIALILCIFIGIVFVSDGSTFAGILLIILYVGAVFWFQAGIPKKSAVIEIKELEHEAEESEKKIKLSPKITILFKFLFSLLLLILSSWLTVHAATVIVQTLEINLALFGASVIAIGTSLPELALEIHAIKKKEYGLALGDIFGSSLLNISLILGVLVLINPNVDLSFSKKILPFLVVSIGWVLRRLIQKKPIIKRDGYFFVIIFIMYIARLFF